MCPQFRTEIKIKKEEFPQISYESKILLMGSCFSDNLGSMFDHYKIPVISNPLGISYNPISIANHLKRITNNFHFSEKDFFEKKSHFNSYELHGQFDGSDKLKLIKEVNQIIQNTSSFIQKASHIYITLGTSWIYERIENGQVVNNCHKQSSKLFKKRILTLEEVKKACESMVSDCVKINPEIKILFTISPVRHLKDGFSENNLSKSILRLAIEGLLKNDMVFYFPSYEIIIDDLRDYRFYEEDMLHPNSLAIKYIWDHIINNQFSDADIAIMKQIEKIQNAFRHKAFDGNSEEYQKFILENINYAKKLREQYPLIKLDQEIIEFEALLTK